MVLPRLRLFLSLCNRPTTVNSRKVMYYLMLMFCGSPGPFSPYGPFGLERAFIWMSVNEMERHTSAALLRTAY